MTINQTIKFFGQRPNIYGHCINGGEQATINQMKKFQGSDQKFPSGN